MPPANVNWSGMPKLSGYGGIIPTAGRGAATVLPTPPGATVLPRLSVALPHVKTCPCEREWRMHALKGAKEPARHHVRSMMCARWEGKDPPRVKTLSVHSACTLQRLENIEQEPVRGGVPTAVAAP